MTSMLDKPACGLMQRLGGIMTPANLEDKPADTG
jgi:hypothetical protein